VWAPAAWHLRSFQPDQLGGGQGGPGSPGSTLTTLQLVVDEKHLGHQPGQGVCWRRHEVSAAVSSTRGTQS